MGHFSPNIYSKFAKKQNRNNKFKNHP